jgi:hypothetical protein
MEFIMKTNPIRIGDDRVCNAPASFFDEKTVEAKGMRIGDDRVCNAPASFFDSNKDGEAISRFSTGVEEEILKARSIVG